MVIIERHVNYPCRIGDNKDKNKITLYNHPKGNRVCDFTVKSVITCINSGEWVVVNNQIPKIKLYKYLTK